MSVYAVWPFFVLIGLLLALAATRLLRIADEPAGPGRLAAIDGLRGFLALGVFAHHAVISHGFMLDGRWVLPPSRFYIMAGQGGVAMFFMITGHLFWTRLLRARGRLDWIALYVGRLFRIGPLFLAACFVAITVALVPRGDWHAVPDVIWASLSLGFTKLPSTRVDPLSPPILGGVSWTLHYEWLFYAALLPLSLLARVRALEIAAPALAFAVCVSAAAAWPGQLELGFAALFLAGMTSASMHFARVGRRVPRPARSAAALALVAAAFLGCPGGYVPLAVILLAGAFHLIAGGADLFGLLTSRPARRLGAISFGLYLLHGPVLAAALKVAPLRAWASGGAVGQWAMTFLCGVTVVLLAGAAHAAVERPGIVAGRGAVAALRPAARPRVAAG